FHVSTLPGGLAQAMMADSHEVSGAGPAPAKTTPELLSAHDESIRKAKEIIASFDDQRAMGDWRLTRGGQAIIALPRAAAIRKVLLNHWIHHRGQLSVYLRLLDVPVPSIYGPSADENPWASKQ